jgi:hypothetical protein
MPLPIITTRPLSNEELDQINGNRKYDIGSTFTMNGHYYLQRENDVLHINSELNLINLLHVGHLNNSRNLDEISNNVFEIRMKEAIFNLDLNQFWN